MECRSCHCNNLQPVLALGNMPLANAFLTDKQIIDEEEFYYPLTLAFCPGCSLLQILETVSPGVLFRNYLYLSSTSERVLQNSKDISDKLIKRLGLDNRSLVVEVASNDGYLLKNYATQGIPVLGIEPAVNIARIAEANGVKTVSEFLTEDLAKRLKSEGVRADVIHANNVIAHIADLHSAIEGIATLIKPDGVVIVETHYAKDLVEKCEFDTIYHEHLCYYSATALQWLFIQHGLEMVDVERIPIHGGSLRTYYQSARGPKSWQINGIKRLVELTDEERTWVDNKKYYHSFGHRIGSLRAELLELLRQIKAAGKSIVAYGASAKSTVLLNYFGIGIELIDYIVDNTPLKQGRYTPGMHLKIYPPSRLLETQPDYVLILAWNFTDDIISKESEYRARGGKFIVPIPELKWDR